jgi:hypothetical protein
MRAGDANRRLDMSAIFHSKRLNNDGPLGASSRLVGTQNDRSPPVIMLLHSVPFILHRKIFRRANRSYI